MGCPFGRQAKFRGWRSRYSCRHHEGCLSGGSIVEFGASVRLAVEVVSTNWRDDYVVKMADYEAMGVAEYWILDYLGLGGRRFIGNPKQPTVTVCTRVDGEYEVRLFRGKDQIVSTAFSHLQVTANDLLILEK